MRKGYAIGTIDGGKLHATRYSATVLQLEIMPSNTQRKSLYYYIIYINIEVFLCVRWGEKQL